MIWKAILIHWCWNAMLSLDTIVRVLSPGCSDCSSLSLSLSLSGAVYLRDQSPTNFAVERSPLPRDMPPYDSRSQEPQRAGVQHSGSLDDHQSPPGSNIDHYDVVHPVRHGVESKADGAPHHYMVNGSGSSIIVDWHRHPRSY